MAANVETMFYTREKPWHGLGTMVKDSPSSVQALSRMLRSIVSMNNKREIQLPDISPHILRHTCTTRLAEAGCDIKVLQYIIGHTDIRTTMRVYNHVDEGRVKREMDKLEEFGKKLTPNSTPIYTKWRESCVDL